MYISAIAPQHARLVLRPLGPGSRDMDVIWTAMGMARLANSATPLPTPALIPPTALEVASMKIGHAPQPNVRCSMG